MKAVILAAGKGTRMRELTQELPKPMLRVGGKPILEHILEGICGAGIREFCIVTGYRADVVEEYFGDGRRWNAQVTYARQLVQDGTGRAPEPAKSFVGSDSFLLTYGDILVKPDTYGRMVRRFGEDQFDGLVTVTAGQDVSKGGIDVFDEQFCLRQVVEKPTAADIQVLRERGWVKEGGPLWYNAGVYMFEPKVYEFTARLKKSPRGEYELTDAINDMVNSGCKIAGLEIEGRWVDVRDPEVLKQLEEGKL
jgi:UDP-N-acetylglucosamine diphosphorylase / glucose-1-phosphate thymidylyltransferase / UDP-N-acetylgalactosamine diphosphorylase / glucosamine-1-phosphate N-acetyltransferase / galactosamine-1-phosphate N-acetyltransferase